MGDTVTSPEADRHIASADGCRDRTVRRSAPLSAGGAPYWHAAARIVSSDGRIVSASLTLAGPQREAIPLTAVEEGLVSGSIRDADGVLDTVRDFLSCSDDEYGGAAVKNYIAAWLCADVVGRCLG